MVARGHPVARDHLARRAVNLNPHSVTHPRDHAARLDAVAKAAIESKCSPKRRREPKITEPPRGFEPRTYALRVRCSTPELRRRARMSPERLPGRLESA